MPKKIMKGGSQDIPLSGGDIKEYFKQMNERPNLCVLNDVNENSNIENIFNNSGHCIFFVGNPADIGHWVACIRKKNMYYYADSFGDNCPNKEFVKLIIKNNGRFFYNTTKMQNVKKNTCGRFAVFICALNKMVPSVPEIDSYLKLFNKDFDMDSLVLKKID